MKSLSGLRTRWAALGAACVIALGGGAIGMVSATVSSGDRTAYFPITPTRVLDTRSATAVTNGTYKLTIEGTIAVVGEAAARAVVPTDASAVAINLTVTGGRKNGEYGFVTAFPCTANTDTVPNASSLNFENSVDIANALTVTTSSNGSICLYVYGTAHLIVDVAGYYADHNHDDRYYTQAQTNTALAGKANLTDLNPPTANSGPVTVDNTGDIGSFTSIAIGTNGNPIISYYDATNNDLKVVACTNPTCTTSTNTTIDSAGDVGYYTSIAIGTNGNPIISYYDYTNNDLKVAACTDPTCTTSTNTTIDNAGDVGYFTSIAIGINGNPIISYYDDTNFYLKVVACTDPTCTTSTNTTIDSAGDANNSIAIGINGNPIISYYDATKGELKVAACTDPTCTTSTNTTIDNAGDVGYDTSIAIGINGNPIISYYDATNKDLKVAVCTNTTCTTSTNTTIDSTGTVGSYTSIAIGINGNPIISYYDATNKDLKVASPWWLLGGR